MLASSRQTPAPGQESTKNCSKAAGEEVMGTGCGQDENTPRSGNWKCRRVREILILVLLPPCMSCVSPRKSRHLSGLVYHSVN